MIDRLSALEAFVMVAECGSFVAAAERLDHSTASVSRQVSNLEDYLGAQLLQRTTRRLSLTEAGRQVLARAQTLLQDWQETESLLSHGRAQVRGRLRINVPVSFGNLRLARLWPAFLKQHPEVALDITLSDRRVDLVDEGFDLAIRIGQLESSTLVGVRLGDVKLKLCAAPDYLAKHGHPENPQALSEHLTIGYSLFRDGDRWQLHRAGGSQRIAVRPHMHSNSGDTCVQAAIAGQGIVLHPDFLVDEALEDGRLVEILPDWQAQTLGLYAIYSSRRHLPAKTQAMLAFLRKALQTD
jgi:DNA-binding transcriptional LysR family regulator